MISIVIPAYNESKTLENNVKEIVKYIQSFEHEVILIDDGSKDTTWDVIVKLAKENPAIKGIKFSRNFGKEAALLAGLAESKGDAVIPMDADLQDSPKDISQMMQKWQEGYKVVECVSKKRPKESFFHKLCAGGFYHTLKKLTKIDMANARDFRLMDRQVVDEILKLEDRNLFFKGMANYVGFKKTTILVDTDERKVDVSKFTLKTLTHLALNAITSFSTAPLKLPVTFGIISFLLAIIMLVLSLGGYSCAVTMNQVLWIGTIGMLMISFVLFSLGVMGFYIGKMYEQVKGRPRYIIEERV